MDLLTKKKINITLLIFVLMLKKHITGAEEKLIENYLPASMQALAYYIDLLQYEPVGTTTIEPPFFAEDKEEEKTTVSQTEISTKPTSSWFQSPSWWSTTTTVKPSPTQKHKPGLYAPYSADQLYPNKASKSKDLLNESKKLFEQPFVLRLPFNSDEAFIQWIKAQKPTHHMLDKGEGESNIFDFLPQSLVNYINTERDEQNQRDEVENLDNFLRNYDDTYGKYNPQSLITGKKRIPPTKTYVEFLLIYDLLKRDAKAANLSKYEGYTEKMLEDLNKLSTVSPQRQLYTLFKKMLDRKEIQRSDVVFRVQKIIKELGDGGSVISKSLMYFPPLQFLP